LLAYHREPRKMISALLALRCTTDVCPLFVVTVVALDQTGSLLANLFCTPGSTSCGSAGHDLLSASNEALVIPLRAGTSLPLIATNVAELMAARASASDC
jgi:hypothetical protein